MNRSNRWYIANANPDIRELVEPGPIGWDGPEGDGRHWTTDCSVELDVRGCVWTSDVGEVRDSRNGDLTRFWSSHGLVHESDVGTPDGWCIPEAPLADNDGDGVLSDADPDDWDPAVPNLQ
jgi:hypothetical protein